MPLVPLYAAGSALRWMGVKPERLTWPVVSVGNLSTGGTGKTPFVMALARLLKADGLAVDVLSRGYGRAAGEAVRVNPAGTAEEFGDEPLMMARAGIRVYVGRRRLEAGRLAEAEGAKGADGMPTSGAEAPLPSSAYLPGLKPRPTAEAGAAPEMKPGPAARPMGVHLLDDGFQHRQLFRDVDVVLVNSEDLADWLLPAGNLREPLSALRRATVFAVPVGDDGAVQRLRQMGLEQPVWRFRREMAVPKGLAGEPVMAFCGIARPEQFFEGLTGAGVQVVEQWEFADHHGFSRRDLEGLKRAAVTSGAKALVTTEKDWVRLGVLGVELENLVAVGLRAVLEDEGGVTAFFWDRIGGLRG